VFVDNGYQTVVYSNIEIGDVFKSRGCEPNYGTG
jgi:hypothetical protein